MQYAPWRRLLVDGLPAERLDLDPDDPGLLLGYTAFETLRTYNRRPFGVGPHIERLRASAVGIGLVPPAQDLLAGEIEALLALCPPDEVEVRVTLTAGGRRILRARALGPSPFSVRCATRPLLLPETLPGWIKHGSRLAWVRAVAQAGVDDVLWVDGSGHFVEGTRSNVFAAVGGRLCTPPADGRLLAGVTRAALLSLSQAAGVEVVEAPVLARGLWTELYLSSTLKELVPVVELDGRAVAGAGPLGQALQDAFRRHVGVD